MDSGLDCFQTKRPRFQRESASLQQLKSRHLKEIIVESGSAINQRSGLDLRYSTNFSTSTNTFAVIFLKPSIPKSSKLPQAALRHPPFLVPRAVGEMQIPPGQVANEKYWYLLIFEFLYMRTEDPLGAQPYLCTSALMLVTPSTLKSKGLNFAFPNISINGSTNPPIAESTCRGTPQDRQILAISGTSSTTPLGYCGAEQTTTTVFEEIALLRCFKDILFFQSVGIWTTLRPTQWQPLLIPGCPVTHMITSPAPRQSRQVFIANNKLSVPQLVMFPTQFQSPWKRVADILMTSFSMTLRELNMMGLSALECIYFVKQAQVTQLCALECSYTQAKVCPFVGSISATILLSRILRIYSLDRPVSGRRSQVSLISFLLRAYIAFLVDSSSRYLSFLSLTKPILLANLSTILVAQLVKPNFPLDSICSDLLMNLKTTMRTKRCSSILKAPQLTTQSVMQRVASSIRYIFYQSSIIMVLRWEMANQQNVIIIQQGFIGKCLVFKYGTR